MFIILQNGAHVKTILYFFHIHIYITWRAVLFDFKSKMHNILWTGGTASAERKHEIYKLCKKFTAAQNRRPKLLLLSFLLEERCGQNKKTEMIFHLFFSLQVFIKFDNQSFFCLLFFSKRDVVKTKNRDDFSSFFLSASIYQIQ